MITIREMFYNSLKINYYVVCNNLFIQINTEIQCTKSLLGAVQVFFCKLYTSRAAIGISSKCRCIVRHGSDHLGSFIHRLYITYYVNNEERTDKLKSTNLGKGSLKI